MIFRKNRHIQSTGPWGGGRGQAGGVPSPPKKARWLLPGGGSTPPPPCRVLRGKVAVLGQKQLPPPPTPKPNPVQPGRVEGSAGAGKPQNGGVLPHFEPAGGGAWGKPQNVGILPQFCAGRRRMAGCKASSRQGPGGEKKKQEKNGGKK